LGATRRHAASRARQGIAFAVKMIHVPAFCEINITNDFLLTNGIFVALWMSAGACIWSTNMTALQTLTIAAALLAGAASLAVAQTEWSGDKFVLDKASPAPRKASPAPSVPTGGYSAAPGFTFQQSLAQEPTGAPGTGTVTHHRRHVHVHADTPQ
jgi:hypothetical protein